jgi:hypothetical protein
MGSSRSGGARRGNSSAEWPSLKGPENQVSGYSGRKGAAGCSEGMVLGRGKQCWKRRRRAGEGMPMEIGREALIVQIGPKVLGPRD